jgi:hypothetical protein
LICTNFCVKDYKCLRQSVIFPFFTAIIERQAVSPGLFFRAVSLWLIFQHTASGYGVPLNVSARICPAVPYWRNEMAPSMFGAQGVQAYGGPTKQKNSNTPRI